MDEIQFTAGGRDSFSVVNDSRSYEDSYSAGRKTKVEFGSRPPRGGMAPEDFDPDPYYEAPVGSEERPKRPQLFGTEEYGGMKQVQAPAPEEPRRKSQDEEMREEEYRRRQEEDTYVDPWRQDAGSFKAREEESYDRQEEVPYRRREENSYRRRDEEENYNLQKEVSYRRQEEDPYRSAEDYSAPYGRRESYPEPQRRGVEAAPSERLVKPERTVKPERVAAPERTPERSVHGEESYPNREKKAQQIPDLAGLDLTSLAGLGGEATGSELLLKQVDAFREKALEIQQLIGDKEKRVRELDQQVKSRETQNTELQQSLEKKRSEANDIMRGVNVQIDRMAQRITANNEEISSELKNRLNEISTQISSGMQVDLTEVTDGMRSDMNELSTEMRNNIAEIKETVQTTLVDQTADMKNTIDGMSATLNDGFEGVKNDLGEKVHSENVKVYRNIQDLLKEMDTTEDQREMLETQIGKLKSQNFILTVLSAINFGMLVIVILFQMGIL